ncbi:MAG: glycoside hydrolase family 36 protein [Promethearchaeota archaeon]
MIKIIEDNENKLIICNESISLEFIKIGVDKGRFSLSFFNNSSKPIYLKNCFSVINFLDSINNLLDSIKSTHFEYDSKIKEFNDELGNGVKIIFQTRNELNNSLSYSLQFKLYDSKDFIILNLINVSYNGEKLTHSFIPLAIENEKLFLSGTEEHSDLNKITWFKNGWQSWSYCTVFRGDERDIPGCSSEILSMVQDNQDNIIKARFYSEYCTVITDTFSKNSLILGFITFKDQFSRITIDYENEVILKHLYAICCLDGIQLSKSSINSSEELYLSAKKNNEGYIGLVDYAKVVKLKNKVDSIKKEVPIGWCSWYYYYINIKQEDMIQNLEFFRKSKDLKINFMQLDDGYFTKIGDYLTTNEKFPNGLTWLFSRINENGFKGGIWTAPFIANRRSELFKTYKDWFLTKSGKPLKTLFNWNAFQYSLDLSRKEVLDYLKYLFKKLKFGLDKQNEIENKPLIQFFKIDFLHAGIPFNADYSNKALTRAQIYYKAIKAIRDSISGNLYLLGCGAPLGPCIGLVDAMRISCDTAPEWDAGYLERYENGRGIAFPGLKPALINTLYRSFMHKHFWINDPDCLMIRRKETKLTLEEIRLQMTIFGLSGGQILISDKMPNLSKEEIDDAKLLIPPFNPTDFDPIPIDAFISPLPSIYALETEEKIGKRFLIAIINWSDNKIDKKLRLTNILPKKEIMEEDFLIFEFWRKEVLGIYKRDDLINLKNINPHSCVYLSIIPLNNNNKNEPLIVSSSIHISQGCLEITNISFDKLKNNLEIQLKLPGYREGDLFIKIPKNKSITRCKHHHEQWNDEHNIWKIHVEFENNSSFSINFS